MTPTSLGEDQDRCLSDSENTYGFAKRDTIDKELISRLPKLSFTSS